MFLCLLRTDGAPITELERARYASRIRGLAATNVVAFDEGQFTAFVAPALVPLRPLCCRRHGLLAVGNVRLDHPDRPTTPHLELLLEAFSTRGSRCIPDLLGDFAFVIWDPRTRTLTAGRDAFGVKTLFLAHRAGLVVLSSHLELVHEEDKLDEEYVADFLLAGDPGPERTIWADARAVMQGSIVTLRDGKLMRERFWDPYNFEPTDGGDEREQVEQFRDLFREAVRVRLEPSGQTWAELSGGLDSSSIVSMAQTLFEDGAVSTGIDGTITIVDELGAGDERRYSGEIIRRFGLPNAAVVNPWPWQDDEHGAPRTDEPRTHYPFFARDRQVCTTVREGGARVLLSGMGSDHCLYGNRLFMADLVARGHLVRASIEMARWAVAEKRSFWTSLARDAVLPLLPVSWQLHFEPPWLRVPPWIEPTFAARLSLRDRLPAAKTSQAPRGSRFARSVANGMQELVRWMPRGPVEDAVDLRFPFLYRPLVEFGLRLPPTRRAQPLAPKWILREAMRGCLPDPIRTRSGKGAIDARIVWGLWQERQRIADILEDPILAQLGIVRPEHIRNGTFHAGDDTAPLVMLLSVLSLETWLFVRKGRWVVRGRSSPVGADRSGTF